jgi:hypothetical protein
LLSILSLVSYRSSSESIARSGYLTTRLAFNNDCGFVSDARIILSSLSLKYSAVLFNLAESPLIREKREESLPDRKRESDAQQ